MDVARTCSECWDSLKGKPVHTKTCSDKCRARRSRRLAREKREAGALKALPEHQKDIAARVRRQTPDAIRTVAQEELRPVVREAITEETMRAIQQMVGLAPAAIEALAADLVSPSEKIRQGAAKLILQYTVGNAPSPEDDAARNLTVHFDLPRPEQTQEQIDDPEVIDAEVVDEPTKTCDSCGADKPVTSFVANSDRCSSCYEEQRKRADQLLADTA
jgi:predicted nucleic acid-binding Zn ribbon protein